LDVPGAQKLAEQWIIELPAAGVLAAEGWNKNFVKAGGENHRSYQAPQKRPEGRFVGRL